MRSSACLPVSLMLDCAFHLAKSPDKVIYLAPCCFRPTRSHAAMETSCSPTSQSSYLPKHIINALSRMQMLLKIAHVRARLSFFTVPLLLLLLQGNREWPCFDSTCHSNIRQPSDAR
ncbi:hypothetical protein BJX70DRAFT_289421 [Aspergillus crustosus]